jgi:putative transposase
MPYVRVWIHYVWATKRRRPVITNRIKKRLIEHIRSNAKLKDIHLNEIDGDKDHLHLLISLGTSQTISKVAHLLKGESSNWINKNKMTEERFEWQEDYFAVSVSESNYKIVKRYIQNQERHHKKNSFAIEYQDFLDNYRFLKELG